MKNKISFLVVLTTAFGAICANASECEGPDCELAPIIIEETVETAIDSEPVISEIKITADSETICEHDYNCPFESADECEIWHKKPVHKTALHPRAPHINSIRVDDILYAIYSNSNISANDSVASPLLERYQMLIRASRACCTEGIIYKMRENGAKDADIYNFLKDDANYYAVATRCLVMNDQDINYNYGYGVNGKMLADVRNACLCKNRQWFDSLLSPFSDIYYRAPTFTDSEFAYKYKDSMQRDITVSVNGEVQTTLGLLGACPK